MKPTRQTQPYRQGAREPGAALTAMTKGTTLYGANPADTTRTASKMGRKKWPQRAVNRPQRLPRPQRTPRPPR